MNSKLRGRGLGIAGALLTLLAGSAAQAEGPAIGGYVDTQYIYNWNKPFTRTNMLRSYDSMDNNITNTAHLALTGKLSDETNYVVEVDAGSDADVTTANGTSNSTAFLQEAYLNWVGASKFGIKAGKFVTYEGIKVVESVANPTISRGFLFNLAEPVTHVGAVATFVAGKFDFAAGLVNGWDQQDDVNKGKTFVGKVGMNWGDPLTLTLSGLYGPEQANVAAVGPTPAVNHEGDQRTSIDLTGLTKIIPKVDLAFQYNWGYEDHPAGIATGKTNDSWSGFGVQPVIHFTDKLWLGGRYEYFANGNGSRVGGFDDFSAYNITVAPGYKINDNVIFRLEYRYDKVATSKLSGDGKIFVGDSITATPQDSQSTTSAQVAVTF